MTNSERFHGSAYRSDLPDIVTIYKIITLVDITQTGTVSPYNPKIKQFIDDSDQIVRDKNTWEKSRNKQRNLETLLQVVGLRCNPQIITPPTSIFDYPKNYNLGNSFKGKHNIWIIELGIDRENVYGNNHDITLLLNDLNQIPIITNLDETVSINPAIFNPLSPKSINISAEVIR